MPERGILLYHPRPVETDFSHPDPAALPDEPLGRDELKAYMRSNSPDPRPRRREDDEIAPIIA